MKQMKRILAYLLVVAMVFTFTPQTSAVKAATANATSSDTTYGFQVSGSKLLDANGNEFVMRGINHSHTWFKDQKNTAMKALSEAGCNTVRLVLSNGVQWSKDDLSSVKDLIRQCKEYKMIAVLEVHDATGKTDVDSLLAAANYFVEMKEAFIGNEAYVIVNIANEWMGTWESSTWKSGYISAINVLRNAGIKNTIMVDAAGWGQYPQSIVDNGQAVLASDPLGNTMFSTHMYEYAGGSEAAVKQNIDAIAAAGVCQIIGEFGWKHSSGDVAEDTILSYCQEKGIGYLAWSWKGNGGGVEYLDLSNDWAGTDLSDWGDKVVNGENGLKKTGKVCTVFTGETPASTETAVTTEAPVSSAAATTTVPTAEAPVSVPPVAGTVNLYKGSLSAASWSNVLDFTTVKNGGTLDASMITADGYFTVEYTGDKDALQFIFQSWSGGAGWAEVKPGQTMTTAEGTYLATFSYDDIRSVYGNNFAGLDRLYVRTTTGGIVLKSIDYVTGTAQPEESVEPSESAQPEESVEPSESAQPAESVEPSESAIPEESVEPSESVQPAESIEPSQSTGTSVNFYSGSKSVSAWSTAVELSTTRTGGTFDPARITKGSSFTVNYTGTKECLQMIFQSWSGGSGWAVMTPLNIEENADGSYTAAFGYDGIVNTYGTSVALMDRIYLQTQNGTITLKSFDFIPAETVTPTTYPTDAVPTTPCPTTLEPASPSPTPGSMTEETFRATDSNVKVIGRTYINSANERWLANTASGIEFTFTGTNASVTIIGDNVATQADQANNQARIAIYVDDQLVEDDMVDEAVHTYDFYENSAVQPVTVRIIKLSESMNATVGIGDITVTSMAGIQPTEEKTHKIEFIGDSITCGYGIDDENINGGYKNATENGAKTYAYKTAANLDADYSIVSVSGIGVVSGYTSAGVKNSDSTLPQYYDNVAYSWSSFGDWTSPKESAWDFDKFQPDVVVINLGTNDSNYTAGDATRIQEFVDAYVDFLKIIRTNNPNATIFCTLGIMGADLYPAIQQAAADYTAETGDVNITCMQFDNQMMSDGICVDWHPSETTNTKAAAKLTDYINQVMGW